MWRFKNRIPLLLGKIPLEDEFSRKLFCSSPITRGSLVAPTPDYAHILSLFYRMNF